MRFVNEHLSSIVAVIGFVIGYFFGLYTTKIMSTNKDLPKKEK